MNRRNFLSMSLVGTTLYAVEQKNMIAPSSCDASIVNWYVPSYLNDAPNNFVLKVKDTDSALGRYNKSTKEISLTDIVKFHGHMCDGLPFLFYRFMQVYKKYLKMVLLIVPI